MTKEEKKQDWIDRERGALWSRNKDGKDYFTGYFEKDGVKTELYVSKNDFKKEGDNQPAFRIFESRPFEKTAPAAKSSDAASPQAKTDGVPF